MPNSLCKIIITKLLSHGWLVVHHPFAEYLDMEGFPTSQTMAHIKPETCEIMQHQKYLGHYRKSG